MTKLHPLAVRAAKWWGEQLENPPPFDTSVLGVTDRTKAPAKGIKNLVNQNRARVQRTLTDKQRKAFENELAALMSKQLERFTFCEVGTNYDPDKTLKDAAKKANIDLEIFVLPIKTRTRVSRERNSISLMQQGKGIRSI